MSFSKKVADNLNELLEQNYKTEKVYKQAAEKSEDQSLRNFFEATAKQRYDFGHELKNEIKTMGEKPDKGSSNSTSLKSKLLDLKDAVLGTNDKSLLNQTIEADKAAVESYNHVLKDTSTYPSTHDLLKQQRDAIYNAMTNVDVSLESMTAPKRNNS